MRALAFMVAAFFLATGFGSSAAPSPEALSLAPTRFTLSDGRVIDGEEGFLLVPENRAKPGSRNIVLHFWRIRGVRTGPPVFWLPGGPGEAVTKADYLDSSDGARSLLEFDPRLTSGRDTIILNQRGVSGVPGSPPLSFRYAALPLDRAPTLEERRERRREAAADAYRYWQGRGVDLTGYDIRNVVADLDDVRAALGYERIILTGRSFGSQWSLAYLRTHPNRVDRALLDGVEPLDYGYDSPAAVWDGIRRIAALAEADPAVRPLLPKEGLEAAVSAVIARLETAPVTVKIARPGGGVDRVAVDAQDFKSALVGTFRDSVAPWETAYRREIVELWPRFVTEAYNGDYRYLAVMARDTRQAGGGGMILQLIDHSLGVSKARGAQMIAEAKNAPVGDVNFNYHAIEDLTPTAEVDDAYRDEGMIAAPVMLIQGDADLSTPAANARYLSRRLANGRLFELSGVSHDAMAEANTLNPKVGVAALDFLRAETSAAALGVLMALPPRFDMPAPAFRMTGPSLYDAWLETVK